MTGYLMSLNGGPISWKSSRQGGVTLSCSEAEFLRQASSRSRRSLNVLGTHKGDQQKYRRITLRVLPVMSENPTNRDRSRHAATSSDHGESTCLA